MARVEILAGRERRRFWSDEQKRAILEEAATSGLTMADKQGMRRTTDFSGNQRRRRPARRMLVFVIQGHPAPGANLGKEFIRRRPLPIFCKTVNLKVRPAKPSPQLPNAGGQLYLREHLAKMQPPSCSHHLSSSRPAIGV
jgi:hypothetical protein